MLIALANPFKTIRRVSTSGKCLTYNYVAFTSATSFVSELLASPNKSEHLGS